MGFAESPEGGNKFELKIKALKKIGRIEIIHNMLRTGFSLDDIAKAAGMSKEEIKELC